MTLHCQVHMRGLTDETDYHILIGWVPKSAAKLNNVLKVDGKPGYWRVDAVFKLAIPLKELREIQRMDRDSLPSLKVKNVTPRPALHG